MSPLHYNRTFFSRKYKFEKQSKYKHHKLEDQMSNRVDHE